MLSHELIKKNIYTEKIYKLFAVYLQYELKSEYVQIEHCVIF